MSNEEQIANKIFYETKQQINKNNRLAIIPYNQFQEYYPIDYKKLKKELSKFKINFCIDEKTEKIISFYK